MEKITADEAARLIEDGDAILISGSGGGHSVPEALLAAVERRFLAEGKPLGPDVGERRRRGRPRGARRHVTSRTRACFKRAITSALVDSPGLVRLAAEDKIEAYTLPQGVLSQLMRDMAAGRPGLITKTGLHTFVDPRQQGARQSPRTPPDFVEVINLAGEEWLFFKPVPVYGRIPARHDRGRGRQRHHGGGGGARRDARDGAGDAARRRHRHRAGQAHGARAARCRQSTSRSRHPRRLRRRRPRAAPDVRDRTTIRAIRASCAFRMTTSHRCRSGRAR